MAANTVELYTCDSLLDQSKVKLVNRDSFIKEQDSQISKLTLELVIQTKLIVLKQEEIKQIDLKLKKEIRHHKFTKVLWGTTSIALTGALVYFMIK